ncbi:MAG: MMPL family transporter [Pseudomonadota bacterium]
MRSPLEPILLWLTNLQLRHPVRILLVTLLTLVPAGFLASRLELRTGFGELLPDDKPSVVELRKLADRLPTASTLIVVAEANDTKLLERWVDELGPKLRKLPPEWITDVDTGPREALDFFEKHKHLYADLGDLEVLHEAVLERWDFEVSKELGTNLENEVPEELTVEAMRERFKKKIEEARAPHAATNGYYIGENGKLAAILVRTRLASMDQRAFELTQRIGELIEEGRYQEVDPTFRFNFTGSLITSAEQYRAVSGDLVSIGAAGIAFVLLIVYLFFLRLRVLVALGISIGVGCLWSFGFAELSIGHLNTATGFLVSIIAGNGMNAMVIYMARYLEARRDEGRELPDALRTASLDTHGATLAVVGVAMVSYGALMLTDFRGFRHFGVIGGAGMFLCWIATYTVLPALLVLAERVRPFKREKDWRDRLSGNYARPFMVLVKRYPVAIAALGLLSAIGAAVCTTLYFTGDPMEYDLRKVRNDEMSPTSAGKLAGRVNPLVGRLNQSGRAIVVDTLDQVEPLVKELERRRDVAPEGQKPFGKIVSVFSVLPTEQQRKIELLTEIRDRLERARKRGFISDAEWAEIEPYVPATLAPIGIADLPDILKRPFQENDGRVGNIVYVAPTPGRSLYDAEYLMQWANSFREVKLPDGSIVRGTGDAVVFSDMLLAISDAAPRVVLAAFLGTTLVILFAFRGRVEGWMALGTLALGVGWQVSVLYLTGTKLNFLNFVALPIAIGVGADYSINVMKRRQIEGDAGIERAFLETGGAVVACSLTTLSGYAALLLSVNGAVRSFGLAAGVGELSTQLTAMLVLPAALYTAARFRARRAEREKEKARMSQLN